MLQLEVEVDTALTLVVSRFAGSADEVAHSMGGALEDGSTS